MFFFFFQAEDGIRDVAVTGVQTCALPISTPLRPSRQSHSPAPTSIETPNSTRDSPYAVWISRTSRSGAFTNRRGGPRHGPPASSSEGGYAPLGLPRPSLGRAPAQPWRASGLPQAVSPALSEVDAAHLGVGAHGRRGAVGDHAALVQHGDLLRDGED